jgi:aryl sulfotransferase
MLIQSPTRIYRSWQADSRRWNAYRPRAGDIVIATYPKSGTTWMQQIVSLLVFQSPELRPIGEIAPWFDRRDPENSPEALMRLLDAQTHRRFIKSHVPYDGMPIFDEVKYIHVARDGRDACLSYHNHCLAIGEHGLVRMDQVGLSDEALARPYPRAPENARDFFLRWMSDGVDGEPDGVPFVSWFNFERTWWVERHRANVLMVHYRDLKADLHGEMRKIAAFLEIVVPEHLWSMLVEAATFANMQRYGNELHPFIARVMNGGAASFFHKGENDRWRGVLTADDMATFENRARGHFEPECAAWLKNGRLAFLG